MRTVKVSAAVSLAFAACGFMNSSHAVPISFEFTGFVNQAYRFNNTGMATIDTPMIGLAVQGLFLIETEGLVRATSSNAGAEVLSFSDASDGIDLISSALAIGGVSYEPGGYSYDVGTIQYSDSKGPVSCGPGCSSTIPDQFLIRDVSSQVPTANDLPFPLAQPFPPAGTYYSRQFTFNSSELDPLNPQGSGNYIDLTQDLGPLDIANIPLAFIGSSYSEFEFVCTNVCRQNSWLTMAFTVTGLTRTVQSVPEPASVALLGVGLLGVIVGRKRRRRQMSLR